MRVRGPVVFTATLLAVGAGFFGLTFGFDTSSRGIPLSVAASLLVLLAAQSLRDLRHGEGALAHSQGDSRLEAAAIGWLMALGCLVSLFGVLLGPPLFVCIYLRRRGRESWLVSLVSGAATAAVFWLVITHAIGAPASLGAAGALARSLWDTALSP